MALTLEHSFYGHSLVQRIHTPHCGLEAQEGQVLGNATKLIISHQHPIGKAATDSTQLTSEPIINYILFLFDANVDYLARPGVERTTQLVCDIVSCRRTLYKLIAWTSLNIWNNYELCLIFNLLKGVQRTLNYSSYWIQWFRTIYYLILISTVHLS